MSTHCSICVRPVRVPQSWESPKKGDECEEGYDQNDNGHVSEGPHCETDRIQIISKSKEADIIESIRLCLPSSRFPGSKAW